MLPLINRLVGSIKVTENEDHISISGLPGNVVVRDMLAVWQNSKIINNLFTHIGNTDIVFNKFFAPDIIYAFQRIINERHRSHNVRAMKKVIAQLYKDTWLKDTLVKHSDILDFNQLSKLNVTLKDHQMELLEIYNNVVPRYKLKGYLVGAGPGTGKTLMGLALSLCLKADTTVCVCPKNAVHTVWADTLKERFKEVPKYWTSLDGTEPPKGMNYYIVHYDYLVKFLNSINKLNIHNPVILLDESHNFNDIKSMRVELFINLCNVSKSENVLWESGTPVKALGGELATLFATIDPFFNDDAQKRFSAIYGKASNVANDILAARMGMVTFKVSSSAVVEGEPIINRINVKIPNGKKYTLDNIREEMRDFIKKRVEYYSTNMQNFEKRYNEILNFYYRTLHRSSDKEEFKKYLSFVKLIRDNYDPVAMKEEVLFCNNYEKNKIIPTLPKEMKNDFKNLKSIIKYYRLKIQGEALGQILGKKRAQCIVDMIPYIGMEDVIDTAIKKTLIFTSYVSAVDACDTYLRKSGYKPILIYGKTNNELAGNVAIFEKDDDINPMIATYASLSSAVPLTMANQMFMLDSPFRSYERDQAIARTHRMGQDQQVYVTDVFLDTDDQPNISTRSKDILDWSRIQVNEILNFKNNGLVLDNELVFENSNNSIATDIAMELVLEEFESLNITLEQEYNYTEQSIIHRPAWTNW